MKYKELADQSEEELRKKLDELHADLMKDYVQISSGSLPKNPGKVKAIKKSIAKIKTALNVKSNQ
ncbi:MAG: 50S ribosomal protein L29 [Nanoarchaeota archaeon]